MNAPVDKDHIQTGEELERCPFPIPYGWYCVHFSHELAVGEIKIEKVFGKEWVLFRGEDNSVGMTDPYCPHLGAHLGHGGTVRRIGHPGARGASGCAAKQLDPGPSRQVLPRGRAGWSGGRGGGPELKTTERLKLED